VSQTAISFYCFNDNDASYVRDFSTNGNTGTISAGITNSTDIGAIGRVGVFNGTTGMLTIGNVTAFNSITGFSIVCKLKAGAIGARRVISHRLENHIFEITAAGNIKLSLYDSGLTVYTCTGADTLVEGIWYTVVCTWDAANINIYLNLLSSVTTAAAVFAALNSNSRTHYIGATDTPLYFFNGSLEMISFYSKELDDDEINAVIENPSGTKFISDDAKIQTGDLIYNAAGLPEVCVWSEEFDEIEFSDNEEQLFNDGELQIFKN